MTVTSEDLARIRREIDAETERRMALAGYTRPAMGQKGDEYTKTAIVRPEPRAPEPAPVAGPRPREAAAMSAEASEAWNAWARASIDRRVEDVYIPAIGEALGRKGNELRDEFEPAIAAAKAEVAEQLQEQVATAVRDFTTGALAPLRAGLEDLRVRMAEAETKLAEAGLVEQRAPLALPGRWMGHA